MKFYQSGRSMVEMLGVLAIIGVLSVGAISGYSKAMMKYKMNKQTEQLTSIIANTRYVFDRNVFNTKNISKNLTYLNQLAISLNIIPPEMISDHIRYTIQDSFGNSVSLIWQKGSYTSVNKGAVDGFFRLDFSTPNNNYLIDYDVCVNTMTLTKSLHADLWQILINKKITGSSSNSSQRFYGDAYCKNSSSYPCLRDLTVKDINELCFNLAKKETQNPYWLGLYWF